jgi:hypothetical protein
MNRIDRRAFIAALAAAGTGCLDSRSENPDNNKTTKESADGTGSDETDTDGENEGMSREEAVEGIDRGSFARLESGLTLAVFPAFDSIGELHSVQGFVPREDTDEPLKLRVVVPNDSDESVTVDADDVPPYGTTPSAMHDGSTLYLAPVESHGHVEEAPDIEKRDGLWRVEEVGDWLPPEFTVEPRGFFVGEYVPVVAGDDELRKGKYRFGDEEHDLTVSVWDTDSPGPDERSRFEGESFPDIEDETRWYHNADGSTRLYLKPSAERVSPPATIEFTLVNRSDHRISGGSRIYKLVDGEWIPEYPVYGTGPSTPIPPGDTDTFGINLHPVDEPREHDAPPLGGGTYATIKDDFAAVFEVDAPPLEIKPPEDVSVERSDGTVTVHTDFEHDADVVVERVDEYDEDEADRVIAQNVYWMERLNEGNETTEPRYDLLSYSVPFLDETVSEVVVEGAGGPSVDERAVCVYDGRAYELTKRDG